jgi:MoaA/NifB/PqqE/SkfB family radical SAM enzyme
MKRSKILKQSCIKFALDTAAFLMRTVKKYDVRNKSIVADRKCDHESKISKGMKYIDDLNWALLDKRLYNTPRDMKDKKEVMKMYCKYIEVEIFSYCNRKCSFCQNAYIDRHSQNVFMPKETFSAIIDQLSTIDYSNTICFHRYNEPLADKIIFDRVREAREKLPNAIIGCHSNGDFATKDILQGLAEAGMSYILITRYPPHDKDWTSDAQQRQAVMEFADKLKLKYEYTGNSRLKVLDFPSLNIDIRAGKLSDIVSNRAASLKNKGMPLRNSQCLRPHWSLHISYDGSINPCCNTRSDVGIHGFMNIGNVSEMSIFDAFSSEKYCLLRYMLKDSGQYKIYPCSVCDEPRVYH